MAYNVMLKGLEVKRDGKNIKGSDFPVEIKEVDEAKGTFWCVGSEESPDRSNDIIRIEGWDLKNYKQNPIGLWCHNYYSNPYFKSLQVKRDKDKKQLLFHTQFDMNYDEARLTFNQFVKGFLNMFSVGFIAGEYKFIDEDNRWSGGIDFEKGHELLELSAVPVPAHPNASILRGIFDETKSLVDLGYTSEQKFMEEMNKFWHPINMNLDAYKEPRLVSVGNGIKALSAAAIDINLKDAVVGYLFDKDEFDEDKVKEWTSKNVHTKPIQKFYQINFVKSEDNEESKILLSILEGEEEKTIESKIIEPEEVVVDDVVVIEDDAIIEVESDKKTFDINNEEEVIALLQCMCSENKILSTKISFNNKNYIISDDCIVSVADDTLVDKALVSEIKNIVVESLDVKSFVDVLEKYKVMLEELLSEKTIKPSEDEESFSLNFTMEGVEVIPVSSDPSNVNEEEKIIISDEDFEKISISSEKFESAFKDVFNTEFNKLTILD